MVSWGRDSIELEEKIRNMSWKEYNEFISQFHGGFTIRHYNAIRRRKVRENEERVLIHIPHVSLDYPKEFKERLLVDEDYFNKENIFMCDYLVDLFKSDKFNNVISPKYSRLYCDVERFRDDNKEEMSKKGMGVIYSKDSNMKEFIKLDDNYKKEVLYYYDEYHLNLSNKIRRMLYYYSYIYIIDLHSFSDKQVKKLFNKKKAPDICIGYDDLHMDEKLLNRTKEIFEYYGYSVKFNYPYSGSYYPLDVDGNIISIMIEINKRIYLDKNNNIDMDKYYKLKSCMYEFYFEFV